MPRFELTEEQVNELANLLQNEIDYIQDTARDAGQPVVYGYTEEDWEETA